MPCIERRRQALATLGALTALAAAGLAGCGGRQQPAPRPQPSPVPSPPPPAVPAPPPTVDLGPRPAVPRRPTLPAPQVPRSLGELKVLAAMRLVAAHPDETYMSPAPEPLLAIPVLEVELHADGRVRNIKVLREPREAKDTVQLAMAAVRRAAPYGDVSRLPRPWNFVEVFLFDDHRRFKPATLDQ